MSQPFGANQSISFSTATIIKIVVAILGIWLIYITADILLLVLAAIFLAAAISPSVDALEKKHIPRSISMLGIYIILFGILSSMILLVIPPLAQEVGGLAQNFPNLFTQFTTWLTDLGPQNGSATQPLQGLSQTLTTATQGVLSTISGIFGGIFSFFMVLVMTFYLVVDKGAISRTVATFPKKYQKHLTGLYERLQIQIGRWLRAQLILMALVGLLTYILLVSVSAIGTAIFDAPKIEYALSLALIAGTLEFIPYLGPLLSAIPAILIAFAISPTMAIVVAAIYYGIQLFENNVLTPKIMERAVGLSPIVSIIVFLVGARIGGMTGAFLAIPIATAIHVIIKDALSTTNERNKVIAEA